ncbi:MFS transporter [Streptomyces sclerotialus]|uniref:MFS transporter n=1 Tax=Streptomyces sclerotialus TaxID=1957 RepID=UPI0004C5D1D2
MERSLRYGRVATFAYFALNGFVLGMWVVHIPTVEQQTGTTHAVLGWLLLLLGLGAFTGMQITGPLTDRLGARTVVPLSAALCSAAVVLPGLAANAWTLAAALLLLGFGNGCLDVSMNAHAVQVERGYGRPVMSAFHATFSLGGVLAALIGARTLSWGWSPAVTLGAVAVFGLVVAAAAAGGLLRSARTASTTRTAAEANPAGTATGTGTELQATGTGTELQATGTGTELQAAGTGTETGTAAARRTRTPRRIWFLAVLAFMLMLCEGVANDWSVLHLRDVLDAPAATAAFAYGAFSTAMTVGRLLADRVSGRFGAVAVLRYGAAVGALGMAVAALSPWVPLALVGWAVFGAGLSGCIPQLFSAAGHADQDAAGVNVSRVAGLGYLGMLAGPAVIGPLTHLAPLNITFFLPVVLCAVAACTAAVLRTTPNPAAVPLPAAEQALDGGQR